MERRLVMVLVIDADGHNSGGPTTDRIWLKTETL